MSLLERARQAKEGFNPASDKAGSNFELPAGEYDAILNEGSFRHFDSGYECVAFNVGIIGGEHDGHEEFININVDPDYVTNAGYKLYDRYPAMLDRNIQSIIQMAYVCDLQLTEGDWDSQESLGNAFYDMDRGAKGSQFILEVEKTESKKGKVYTNYHFKKYDQEPQGAIVEDDDLPF